MTLSQKTIDKFVSEALAIEAEEAKDAGKLGYMARAFVQATLPHRKIEGNEFVRTNGHFTLTMLAPSAIGLPYGSIPRLLLAWLSTEAVKTKQRELVLGDSLSAFMRQLDLVPTGGRWGTITRLREQTKRLFTTYINCTYSDIDKFQTGNRLIVEDAAIWWNPKQPGQTALWESTVLLAESFYQEVIASPVPLDMRALKSLRSSPMALDLYCWLTYRMSYLKRHTEIPWGALQAQFGANYPTTTRGRLDFKRNLLKHMGKIHAVYKEANVFPGDKGLILRPSRPHIKKRGVSVLITKE